MKLIYSVAVLLSAALTTAVPLGGLRERDDTPSPAPVGPSPDATAIEYGLIARNDVPVEDVTAIEYKLKLEREEVEPDASMVEYATIVSDVARLNGRREGGMKRRPLDVEADVARLNGVHTDVAHLD